MAEENLDELLQELRDALDGTTGLAAQDRARLASIVTEIEETVDDEHQGVLDQIEDVVHRFEVEHRGLVRVLNRIADTLSASGI